MLVIVVADRSYVPRKLGGYISFHFLPSQGLCYLQSDNDLHFLPSDVASSTSNHFKVHPCMAASQPAKPLAGFSPVGVHLLPQLCHLLGQR